MISVNKFLQKWLKITFKTLIFFILTFITSCFISWICTCGVIKIVSTMYGLEFDWYYATSLWLGIEFMSLFFRVLRRLVKGEYYRANY